LTLAAPLASSAETTAAGTSAVPNFEGIWLPDDGMGRGATPGPGLPGGPPQGAGGPPPTGADGGPGGPAGFGAGGPPGGGMGGGDPGEPPNQTQVVNCAPLTRLDGGAGGASNMVIQSPTEVVLLVEEYMDIARQIYINGQHPKNLKPQPNGHSIGHWEGQELVVDTIGYADKNGKDTGQHMVERWSLDGDALVSKATVTDKSGKSMTRNFRWVKEKGLQFNENVCEEAFDRFQYVDGKLIETNTAEEMDLRSSK
jgi:hypothetical protein